MINYKWTVDKHINFMKSTYTEKRFIELCKLVTENHTKLDNPQPICYNEVVLPEPPQKRKLKCEKKSMT